MGIRLFGFCDFSGKSDAGDLLRMARRGEAVGQPAIWFERHQDLSCGLGAAQEIAPLEPAQGRTDWQVACEGWLEQQDRTLRSGRSELGWAASALSGILDQGIDAFTQLNGEYALAAVNRAANIAYLVRDRWGTKPLYYSWIGARLIFAADLRALTGHPDFQARLHRAQLTSYFAYDAVPAPDCILKNVFKLAPGHALRIDLASETASIACYWHLADELNAPADALTEDEAGHELLRLFSIAVSRRRRYFPDCGVFLTSGYDSTMITALLQRESSSPVRTFCVGFDEPELNEAPFAEAVAARIGAKHTTIACTGADMARLTAELPEIYDEPLGVHSLGPTLLGWRLASREVPGLYSGDGASTLIGPGNPALLFGVHDGPHDTAAEQSRAGDRRRVHLAGRGAGFRYATDEELRALLTFSGRPAGGHYEDLRRLAQAGNRLQHASNLVHHVEQARAASDRMFPRVDRAASHCYAQVLYPFTDNDFLAFALRLPARYKYHAGESKYLFKKLVRGLLGDNVVNKAKMGFESPHWRWLSHSCKPLLDEYLDVARIKADGLFRVDEIQRLRNALVHSPQVAVQKRSASRLRQILYFQLWRHHWRQYGLQLD